MVAGAVRASSGARGWGHCGAPAELLVAISVVGLLISLPLPAVGAAGPEGAGPEATNGSRPGATQTKVTVCTWRGGKKAAYCFTIDDGVPDPTPIMAKVFNDNHVKATWYPVVKSWTNWKMWAELIESGHEVGSHTKTHPALKRLTDEQKTDEIVGSKAMMESGIRKYLPDYLCLTFAFPGSAADADEASQEIARNNYVTSKHGWGINAPSPGLSTYNSQGARTATPLAELDAWVDEALKTGGWQTETYHGIQGVGGWEATPLEVFEAHVQYAASKADQLWIDTVAQIAMYIRERDTASVEVTTDSAEELVMDLMDKMDDAVYNAPLTLRILPRPEWKSPLTVTQNGRATRLDLTEEAGRPCAYIDAVPDRGPIVVRPAAE